MSPLSVEPSESPELYQTARLTAFTENHMSAGKGPDTARRGALTLPLALSQIQVMSFVLLTEDQFLFGIFSSLVISALVFFPRFPSADRV